MKFIGNIVLIDTINIIFRIEAYIVASYDKVLIWRTLRERMEREIVKRYGERKLIHEYEKSINVVNDSNPLDRRADLAEFKLTCKLYEGSKEAIKVILQIKEMGKVNNDN